MFCPLHYSLNKVPRYLNFIFEISTLAVNTFIDFSSSNHTATTSNVKSETAELYNVTVSLQGFYSYFSIHLQIYISCQVRKAVASRAAMISWSCNCKQSKVNGLNIRSQTFKISLGFSTWRARRLWSRGNKGEGAGQGCVFTVKQAGGIATRKGGMNEERGEIGRRCTKGIIVNAKPEPWPAGL